MVQLGMPAQFWDIMFLMLRKGRQMEVDNETAGTVLGAFASVLEDAKKKAAEPAPTATESAEAE